MPLKKRYNRGKATANVTFILPESFDPRTATVAGEFNGWDKEATPLTKEDGVWQTTIKLEAGREYQYRYLLNGSTWENDDAADNYVAHPYGGENSVVELYPDS